VDLKKRVFFWVVFYNVKTCINLSTSELKLNLVLILMTDSANSEGIPDSTGTRSGLEAAIKESSPHLVVVDTVLHPEIIFNESCIVIWILAATIDSGMLAFVLPTVMMKCILLTIWNIVTT